MYWRFNYYYWTTDIDKNIILYAKWGNPVISEETEISIATPDFEDVVGLLSFNIDTKKFTALPGYTSYTWYLEETKQSCTTDIFKPDISMLEPGSYNVSVIVTDNQGNVYSASYIFQIKQIR